jgi:hypothetical protein
MSLSMIQNLIFLNWIFSLFVISFSVFNFCFCFPFIFFLSFPSFPYVYIFLADSLCIYLLRRLFVISRLYDVRIFVFRLTTYGMLIVCYGFVTRVLVLCFACFVSSFLIFSIQMDG